MSFLLGAWPPDANYEFWGVWCRSKSMSPEHPDFPLADFQIHLLACKGVLSATLNAKDMTSDALGLLENKNSRIPMVGIA